MTRELVVSEEWALPLERAEGFFRSLEDARVLEPGRFRVGGCVVALRPLPERRVAGLGLPRLVVEYSGGAEEDVAAVRRRFLLRFVSAGG